MRKKLIYVSVLIIILIILMVPVRRSALSKGLIIFNSDESFVFFIPLSNMNFSSCSLNGDNLKGLKGVQILRVSDLDNFYPSTCYGISTNLDSTYGDNLKKWHLQKVQIRYSSKESILDNIQFKLNSKQMQIETDNFALKFDYVETFNLDSVRLEKIK